MTAPVDAFALSTTFTPPATCTENHFTMLERLDYRIYKNYPDPAGTPITDCYPTQYLASYFAQKALQTPLPAFAPLVCPVGYNQVLTDAAGYRACCPVGFSLAAAVTSAIPTRPAYGATCYSDIFSLLVTSYNRDNVVATSTWTALSTGSQAYALVFEGFANAPANKVVPAKATGPVTLYNGTEKAGSNGSSTAGHKSSKSDSGNGGMIVSGIVGGVAGLVLLLALAL